MFHALLFLQIKIWSSGTVNCKCIFNAWFVSNWTSLECDSVINSWKQSFNDIMWLRIIFSYCTWCNKAVAKDTTSVVLHFPFTTCPVLQISDFTTYELSQFLSPLKHECVISLKENMFTLLPRTICCPSKCFQIPEWENRYVFLALNLF